MTASVARPGAVLAVSCTLFTAPRRAGGACLASLGTKPWRVPG